MKLQGAGQGENCTPRKKFARIGPAYGERTISGLPICGPETANSRTDQKGKLDTTTLGTKKICIHPQKKEYNFFWCTGWW